MDPIEYLRKSLSHDVTSAKQDLEQFTAKLAQDPVYALEWSQRSFQAQAKAQVASKVLVWLANPDFTLEKLKKEVQSAVNRSAMYPSFSTSVTTNLMHQYMGAAWAELAERIDYL